MFSIIISNNVSKRDTRKGAMGQTSLEAEGWELIINSFSISIIFLSKVSAIPLHLLYALFVILDDFLRLLALTLY